MAFHNKIFFLALSILYIGNGLALTLVPRATLPNNTLCVPSVIPPTILPSDFLTCAQQVAASKNQTNEDEGKTTDQIATLHGYNSESYNVTTSDGYIITISRINGSPLSPVASGKPSVFVHHGIAGSSDNWLFQYGDRNLAFKLADAGYDVWLANCRGTTYSQGHTTLNANDDVRYWDFSWHEVGMYDIPAVLNKITEVSGNQRMYYIGYSMGTSVFFVSMSQIPELNNKIIAAFLLAPVAYLGHSNNAMKLISPALGIGSQYLLDPVLRGRVSTNQQSEALFNASLGTFCTPTAARCGVCDNLLYTIFGFDAPQMNYTNLPNILSHVPNTFSVKMAVHYSQLINSCTFRQFDYGLIDNLKKYKQATPPSYNLGRITAPTYLFYGESDNLANPQDAQITKSKLTSSTSQMFRVNLDLFQHLDFQMAKDADTLVYNKVFDFINSIQNP